MNWRRRLREWIAVIRFAHGKGAEIPWWGMFLAILSGPVPRAVWRQRMRQGCYKCVLFRRDLHACSSIHPRYLGLGCSCYTPFLALWAEPYPGGCIAKFWKNEDVGWPAYRFPSRWARLWAPVAFLLGR